MPDVVFMTPTTFRKVTVVELVGGKKCGQVDAPREAPSNLETPSAVVLFNIFFALAFVDLKK